MTKSGKTLGGFDFVNMLRGVAALLVIYFHLYIHILHRMPPETFVPGTFGYLFIFGAIDLGKFAVGLFFIISGFLIPATLGRADSSLRDYVIHRGFRLYPAYWVSILVTIAIGLIFDPPAPFPTRVILANVTMFQKFIGIPDLVGAYWTLQIELIFYIVCAAMFLLRKLDRRREMIWLALAGGIACAVMRRHYQREFPVAIFAALALMFLGDSIRAFSGGKLSRRELNWSTITVLAGLVPMCFVGYVGEGARYVLTYWIAIAIFLLSYQFRHIFSDIGPIRVTGLFLADCSYSVYLLHSPVGLRLATYLFRTTHSGLVAAAGAFGSTILCAYVTYRLVEAPGIWMGRKLTPKNRQPTPLTAMAEH